MKISAVLLEVSSIQQYVFGSNKLKENLCASYLVENIFKPIKIIFKNLGLKEVNISSWQTSPADNYVEIGYFGGGNALLFFKNKNRAIEMAKEWTKILLVKTPGLVPSIAITELEHSTLSNENEFPNEMKRLFTQLRDNKSNNQPQTTFPRHGITAECSHTGLSAEFFDDTDVDKATYISSVAMSKKTKWKEANRKLHEDFKDILKGKYRFPSELDKMGQKEDDNHISIVHIDGNGMGLRFRSCKTLQEISDLSRDVKAANDNSFKALLTNIVQKYDYFNKNLDLDDNVLPIRPIIIGGDDITFISHGKFGIYFADIFLKEFTSQEVSDKKELSACAGVAITKTKYPFYRGYELAEQLCGHAKKKAREEHEDASSWLDFHIAYGGFSGSIEDIRKKNYEVASGKLCLRPYRVAGKKVDYQNLNECLNGVKYLVDKWPRSKLGRLREVLAMGTPEIAKFTQEMKFRNKTLPDIKDHTECKNMGWLEGVTPYFDMLELMKIYPDELIHSGDDDYD